MNKNLLNLAGNQLDFTDVKTALAAEAICDRKR